MATANIRAVITAEDRASKVVQSFGGSVDDAGKKTQSFSDKIKGSFVQIAALTAGATIAFKGLAGAIMGTIDAANRQQNAFLGLSSIARAFGQDADKAKKSAESLAKDGLMTIGEAAAGLKNLLAAGFNLPQAVTLMNRFKDSAAFGRQGALSFGEAIRGATEGIKNGNSILVDNAGVTKNLSVILEEAGYSAQDLMRATSDAGVRQAIFNGILKETNPMLGDAGRLAGTAAGQQSKFATSIEQAKASLGEAFQPALKELLNTLQPIIDAIKEWVKENPKLAAAIGLSALAFLGLAAAVGAVATAFVALDVSTGGLALVIMGAIAGLVTAGALLIVHWEKVKTFFINAWNFIAGAFGAAFEWVKSKVDQFRQHFWENIGFIIGFFATLPIKLPLYVIGAIAAMIKYLVSIDWGAVFRKVGDAFGRVWESIKNMAKDAFNWIKNINWGDAIKGIGNAVIGLIEGAINGALAGIPGLGKIKLRRFANGVENFGGGLAMVGERGPELVSLPRGSSVKNATETSKMAGTTNIYISPNIGVYTGSNQEMRRLSQEIITALRDVANSKNMTIQELLG